MNCNSKNYIKPSLRKRQLVIVMETWNMEQEEKRQTSGRKSRDLLDFFKNIFCNESI